MFDDPANGQRETAVGPDFHGHLIGGAAHPAGFHFDQRLDVFHRLVKELQGIVVAPLTHNLHGVVKDALGHALLAPLHQAVDKPAHQDVVVFQVRGNRPLDHSAFSGHL